MGEPAGQAGPQSPEGRDSDPERSEWVDGGPAPTIPRGRQALAQPTLTTWMPIPSTCNERASDSEAKAIAWPRRMP